MEKKKSDLKANERLSALENAIAKIHKEYGEGSIMKMTENSIVPMEIIPSGCIAVDIALGIGGFPRGRIIEIYGPESSGKTTLSLHAIAEAQKLGGQVAFIDAEHALDPFYATKLGVDLNKLYISQPDDGEQALEITDQLVRSGAIDLIVVDSVAALTPRAEIDGEMGDSHMGLHARLMSQALRKLAGVCDKSKTCIIFINQLREKIGVMFGNPETTTGGKALKFYASIRLDVRRVDSVKEGSDVVGNRTKVKVVKNKLAPPFKLAEFDIIFGKGISNEGCLIDVGINLGLVTKSGSWISYNGERICQGRENFRQLLETNQKMAQELQGKITEMLEAKKNPAQTEGVDSDDKTDK